MKDGVGACVFGVVDRTVNVCCWKGLEDKSFVRHQPTNKDGSLTYFQTSNSAHLPSHLAIIALTVKGRK